METKAQPLLWKSNLHTHSNFSDGKNSIFEMVAAAQAAGIEKIAITDHCPIPIECSCNMKIENFQKYIAEIEEAQKKFPQIQILKGLELDYLDEQEPLSRQIISHLDITIASVHFLKLGSNYIPIDESVEKFKELITAFSSLENLISAYTTALKKSIQIYNPTIIGHIDLFTKFNELHNLFDEAKIDWDFFYCDLLDEIKKRNITIEINTGAISRGYKTAPYPNKHLLKLIKKKGISNLTITGDSHSTSGIATAFNETFLMLQNEGFIIQP